ncbi:hypothetical protein SK128_016595 [Halocaridina rubra]|uniref:Uncharacterized protein n=1 Tax=Halocaridina rubra TaxID=373956 RepID=A0AAN9A8P2_HALRR
MILYIAAIAQEMSYNETSLTGRWLSVQMYGIYMGRVLPWLNAEYAHNIYASGYYLL